MVKVHQIFLNKKFIDVGNTRAERRRIRLKVLLVQGLLYRL